MPPAGFKRSRALWDEARRPKDQKLEEWKSVARAILYELQPIRFSQYSKLSPSSLVSFVKARVIPAIRQFGAFVSGTLLPRFWSLLCNMTLRQWMIVGGVFLYYLAIRWIHEILNAGPLVLIITALVAIFTVGLGDNADGELSAYSAFNRGFQRLMGSVDVENLVNQHVGGGMMMAGAAAAGGMRMMPPEPNNNNNNDNPPPLIRPPREDELEDDDSDYDDNDDRNGNEQPQQQQHQQRRRAGKKNRRRNLEERQEQRRQREVARAMGFDGTGGHEEAMAMQRLIEEQAAAAAAVAGGNQER